MRPRIVLVLLLVTAVRLAALPLRGTEDVGTWKIWMIAASKDATTVYGVGGHPPIRGVLEWKHLSTTVDYPPMALYELGAMGWIYRLVDPELTDGGPLTSAVKIPGLIFGIGLTIFLWWTARRFTGSDRAGEWAALAYWCNPASILNGEVLGYLDPLAMLPALASLVLIHLGATAWGGACLSIAMLTKPQAILVAPIVALATWRGGGTRACVTALAGWL